MTMTVVHHAELIQISTVTEVEIKSADETSVIDEYIERFGIAEARELTRRAYIRPATLTQTFIVRSEFMTLEAQNALLKLLEEPPELTNFVFVLPSDFYVIDTLRSRFAKTDSNEGDSEAPAAFKVFKSATIGERLQQIETALKAKDISWQREIKTGLIYELKHAKGERIAELEFVSRWLLTRGASNKMLFEQAALVL